MTVSKKERMLWIKRIAIVIGAAILIIVGLAAYAFINATTPTKGKRIAAYDRPRAALLVIDIQEDYTGTTAKPPLPYKNAKRLIDIVNQVIARAAAKDMPVVYIRQEFGKWARFIPGAAAIKGTPGSMIDARVRRVSPHEFPKKIGDAFSNPGLGALLVANRVDHVYLVGLDVEYCVHSTARGALNRGYTVTVLTDAVALQNEEKWDALLKEYHEEGIRLIESATFGD